MFNILAHLFIPRPSNNHKAKLLHSSTLVIIIITLILIQGIFQLSRPLSGQVLGYAANISSSEVESLTNQIRTQNGLQVLKDNPVLDAAALAKGQDMLAKGYWAHVAPDGTQPWAFFVHAGYGYQYAGENLARDFPDAASAVSAWMASPTHKENILSPNYKEIGIGVVEGNLAGVDTTIIVQFFGTKLGTTATATQPLPSPTPVLALAATPLAVAAQPTLVPTPIVTPAPVKTTAPLVAASKVTPFNITKYLSISLISLLILVVAIDGFLINKRKIFRIAGHFPAHIAFLGMILIIIVLAKVGRII